MVEDQLERSTRSSCCPGAARLCWAAALAGDALGANRTGAPIKQLQSPYRSTTQAGAHPDIDIKFEVGNAKTR